MASAFAAAPYAPAPYHPAAPAYPDVAPAYNYAYAVADDYSGSNFGATEARDGYATHGEYHVALPDGRIQTVTYNADPYGYGGYVAEVTYTGEPKYPEYKPAPYHPAPAYKPAPYHA